MAPRLPPHRRGRSMTTDSPAGRRNGTSSTPTQNTSAEGASSTHGYGTNQGTAAQGATETGGANSSNLAAHPTPESMTFSNNTAIAPHNLPTGTRAFTEKELDHFRGILRKYPGPLLTNQIIDDLAQKFGRGYEVKEWILYQRADPSIGLSRWSTNLSERAPSMQVYAANSGSHIPARVLRSASKVNKEDGANNEEQNEEVPNVECGSEEGSLNAEEYKDDSTEGGSDANLDSDSDSDSSSDSDSVDNTLRRCQPCKKLKKFCSRPTESEYENKVECEQCKNKKGKYRKPCIPEDKNASGIYGLKKKRKVRSKKKKPQRSSRLPAANSNSREAASRSAPRLRTLRSALANIPGTTSTTLGRAPETFTPENVGTKTTSSKSTRKKRGSSVRHLTANGNAPGAVLESSPSPPENQLGLADNALAFPDSITDPEIDTEAPPRPNTAGDEELAQALQREENKLANNERPRKRKRAVIEGPDREEDANYTGPAPPGFNQRHNLGDMRPGTMGRARLLVAELPGFEIPPPPPRTNQAIARLEVPSYHPSASFNQPLTRNDRVTSSAREDDGHTSIIQDEASVRSLDETLRGLHRRLEHERRGNPNPESRTTLLLQSEINLPRNIINLGIRLRTLEEQLSSVNEQLPALGVARNPRMRGIPRGLADDIRRIEGDIETVKREIDKNKIEFYEVQEELGRHKIHLTIDEE